ncbi:ribonuclease H-like domain-containing protein [Tanacetum coccineum]
MKNAFLPFFGLMSMPFVKNDFLHVHALHDPNWKKAMLDEYNALITNGTWVLMPRPANVNIVISMWLLKHKHHANRSLSRYKARLVANGRSQQQGIDCDNTFSLVVKPATIRTVLSIDVSRSWHIHQLDSETESSLFIYHRGSDIAYLLLYVVDIILTASTLAFLQRVIASLHGEFAMTDLGLLTYFLRISAQRSSTSLFLSKFTYAKEILERAHMQKCNPCRTLVDTEPKLEADGDCVNDPTLYQSLAGAL